MKTDLNSNLCQWKHMAKNLCDHVKLNKQQDPLIKEELGILSVDEIFELAIYDANSI